MIQDFILPDIGEGIVECEIVDWLVNIGDIVKEDQPICDVMTDKALVQIPATKDGVIAKFHYQKGDLAKVHSPLFSFTIEQSNQASNTDEEVVDFILPDIGEGIVECEIVDWLVDEGQTVKEDQAICDVVTDKALVQIPSKQAGILIKQYYKKGEIAKVHAPLFQIKIDSKLEYVSSQKAEKQYSSQQLDAEHHAEAEMGCDIKNVKVSKALASPAVRRRAREMEIDLTQIKGTGKCGRVLKQDLKDYIDLTNNPITAIGTNLDIEQGYEIRALSSIQQSMANQMVRSVSEIPHFSFSDEVKIDALLATKQQLKTDFEAHDIKLTLTAFWVKALSMAMRDFPIVNSEFLKEQKSIKLFHSHNIGVAVDSPMGLIVPNIKDCQNKSVFGIAKELARLTADARHGRVKSDDLKGGTITVSNIGAIGAITAVPIINAPEVAIVAIGKAKTSQIYDQSTREFKAASIVTMNWSGDHRVLDGATLVKFNNHWRTILESPAKMLAEFK